MQNSETVSIDSFIHNVSCSWIGYDGRGYKGKQARFLPGEYEEDNGDSPFDGNFASNGGISALRKIQIVCIINIINTSEYEDNDETFFVNIRAHALFLQIFCFLKITPNLNMLFEPL